MKREDESTTSATTATGNAPPFVLRAAEWDDLDGVTGVLNRCGIAMTGHPEQTAEEIAQEWGNPQLDLARSTRVAVVPGGAIVGYVEVWDLESPPVAIWIWGRVDPAWEGRGIGTALMTWAEARARKAVPLAPDDARVAILSGTVSSYEPAVTLLREWGMRPNRHFWDMLIELDTPPPPPQLPEGIEVISYEQFNDPLTLFRAVDEAFEDHWGHVDQPEEVVYEQFVHYELNHPDFDPSLWFIALDGEQIAGAALCTPRRTQVPGAGWINTLGVRRSWRNQGLGLALLHYTFGAFYQRGTRRVGLGVDAASLTGATRLYEKAGMHVLRQFDSYEKVLRPGRDLVTRDIAEE